MASATHTMTNYDASTDTQTLVGHTTTGSAYKDVTRTLGLPKSLETSFKIGSAGAKGNDKAIISMRNSVLNATSGLISTGTAKIELSIPRDTAWTEAMSKNLLANVCLFCSNANIDKIVDGITP